MINREEIEREIQKGIEEAREQGVVCGDVIYVLVQPDHSQPLTP